MNLSYGVMASRSASVSSKKWYSVMRPSRTSQISAQSLAGDALQVGDVLVSLNGAPITATDSLTALLAATTPGQVVQVGIQRRGADLSVPVQLIAAPWREDLCLRAAMQLQQAGVASVKAVVMRYSQLTPKNAL